MLVTSLSAYALPSAKNLTTGNVQALTVVPGFTADTVRLAAALEFSNMCSASNKNILSHQDGSLVSVYSSSLTPDLICTADYKPVYRWAVVASNLKVGDTVNVNGTQSLVITAPEPAICIKSLCEDGSARDSYTCACPNGYSH